MRLPFLVLAATLAIVVSGCATQPVSLAPQARQNIADLQVVLFVPQEQIDVNVVPSNVSTGLLGALIVGAIDEARRQKAAQIAVPVIQATRDFGFRERMAAQLSAEFARVPWLRLHGPLQVETTDSESQRRIIYDTSRAPAVLMASFSYQLLDARLVVTANAQMYPKSPALMKLRNAPVENNPLHAGNAIYRRTFVFRSDKIAPAQIRESLNEGLANVAWQLAADLAHAEGSADSVRSAALPPRFPAALRHPPAVLAAPGLSPPPARATAAAPLAATTVAAPASMRAGPATGRWDGAWSGRLRCGPYLGSPQVRVANREGWTVPVRLKVIEDRATMERGSADYREVLTGDVIGAMAHLEGQGQMNQTNAPPWRTQMLGRFTGGEADAAARFEGNGRIYAAGRDEPVRDCSFELTRTAN